MDTLDSENIQLRAEQANLSLQLSGEKEARQYLEEEFKRERDARLLTVAELDRERSQRMKLETTIATMQDKITKLERENEQLRRDNAEIRRQNKKLLQQLNDTGRLNEEPKTDPTLNIPKD